MTTLILLTVEEVAQRLHKSPRWLQDFLRDHPTGPDGRPFFRLAGRTRLFSESDVGRLYEALPCPSSSSRRDKAKARTGRSALAAPATISHASSAISARRRCRPWTRTQ